MSIRWTETEEEQWKREGEEYEEQQKDNALREKIARQLFTFYAPTYRRWETSGAEERRPYLLDADVLMGIMEENR